MLRILRAAASEQDAGLAKFREVRAVLLEHCHLLRREVRHLDARDKFVNQEKIPGVGG